MNAREQWLKRRKQFLTASDVAAVLGVESAFKNILDVYMDKTTDDVVEYDMPILRYGHRMEPLTADLFARQTGREVRDPGGTELTTHPDIPWIAATLDREVFVDGEWYPLEIKQVVDPSQELNEWLRNPPEEYWLQCQTQMACKQRDRSFLVGQFRGRELARLDVETFLDLMARMDVDVNFCDQYFDLAVVEIQFDEPFFYGVARAKLQEFWTENVLARRVPEVTAHVACQRNALQSVKRVHRHRTGETIALDDNEKAVCEKWLDHKWDAGESKKKAQQCEAQLRGALGSFTYGAFSDGTYLERDTRDRLKRKR